MEFKKYNSITNSYNNKTVFKYQTTFPNEQYIVQEKIHGANFSIWYDGVCFKFASRNHFLVDDEKFHDYKNVVGPFLDGIERMYGDNFCSTITIFGEIFGGTYPHDRVNSINVGKVQAGVFYTPDVNFRAFDMMFDGVLFSPTTTNKLLADYFLPFCPILKTGTLDECLAYPNDFNTKIPGEYALPKIENNICEGTVIKPINPLFIGESRVILKNKNAKFTERISKKKTTVIVNHSIELQQLIDEQDSLINVNRLRNVLSKMSSEIVMSDFGIIMKSFTLDVTEELVSAKSELINNLSKSDSSTLKRILGTNSARLLKLNIVDIINGDF